MDPNKSQNAVEDDLLNEFDFSSITSNEMDWKEMAELIEEFQKLKIEFQQNKEANSNQFGGHSMMQMSMQTGEMETEMDGLKAEVGKLAKENNGLKEKMAKMIEEIVEKNGEMGKMKAEIQRLFAENAKLEGKMRELQEQKWDKKALAHLTGRIEGMEFIHLNLNKWNAADCGPKWDISEGGSVVKHNGQQGINSIRAILAIPFCNLKAKNPSIVGYFEVQIASKHPGFGIDIGFCTEQFSKEGYWLGIGENSIGICEKEGMSIDGQYNKFENANGNFKADDVIGIGIIHTPTNFPEIECFATCNGELLGAIELPDNFAILQLFPAVTLLNASDSIRANFGQKKWRFNPNQLLQ